MHSFGLKTCADVQLKSKEDLASKFGKFGLELYNLSRGIDFRPVVNSRRRKSFSMERTSETDFSHQQCHDEFDALILKLFSSLEDYLLRNNDYRIKTAVVKVKFNDFQTTTVERAWKGTCLEHYQELLSEALSRSSLEVRLLGGGVKFFDESGTEDLQLDFLDLLFGDKF